MVKSNLAEFPPSLAYRVVGVQLDGAISTSRIEWLGQAPEIDVRELLSARDPDERSAREDAIEFLVEAGVQETAQPVADLMKAASAMQIGEKTLQRARRSLGIPARLDEFGGAWKWGPKPDHGLDTQSGPLPPAQMSRLDLPAETPPERPSLDTVSGLGEAGLRPPLHPDCPTCDRRWFHGHAEDCSRRSAS